MANADVKQAVTKFAPARTKLQLVKPGSLCPLEQENWFLEKDDLLGRATSGEFDQRSCGIEPVT